MPFVIRIKREFQAAHFITDYHGNPEPLHGHTWEVEIYIKADKLDKGGIGYDFVEIHKYLDSILPDYKCLNEIYNFSPSAENLAKHIYYQVKKQYPSLIKVVVWETKHGGAEYYEE